MSLPVQNEDSSTPVIGNPTDPPAFLQLHTSHSPSARPSYLSVCLYLVQIPTISTICLVHHISTNVVKQRLAENQLLPYDQTASGSTASLPLTSMWSRFPNILLDAHSFLFTKNRYNRNANVILRSERKGTCFSQGFVRHNISKLDMGMPPREDVEGPPHYLASDW